MSGDPNFNQGRNPWHDPKIERDIARSVAWTLFVAGVIVASIFSAVSIVYPHLPK